MKGKIFKLKGIGLYFDIILVENREVYEFTSSSSVDDRGYFKITFKTRSPPYKKIVKYWNYRKYVERCNKAPFASAKELYSMK